MEVHKMLLEVIIILTMVPEEGIEEIQMKGASRIMPDTFLHHRTRNMIPGTGAACGQRLLGEGEA